MVQLTVLLVMVASAESLVQVGVMLDADVAGVKP